MVNASRIARVEVPSPGFKDPLNPDFYELLVSCSIDRLDGSEPFTMERSGAVLPGSLKPKFFEGLESREVGEILDAAAIRKVGAHQIILVAGDTASHLFLLLSGDAKFYRLSHDGDRVLLSRLGRGDVFGLGSLLSRRTHYIGTAETTRDSEFLVWEHSRIRKLALTHPRLAENALAIVLQYLAAHAERLVDFVTLNAAERLARVVFNLSKQAGKIGPTGVEIAATNDELSELANVSRFTASRLLNNWARRGAVAKSRGKIFIYSPEKLLEQ